MCYFFKWISLSINSYRIFILLVWVYRFRRFRSSCCAVFKIVFFLDKITTLHLIVFQVWQIMRWITNLVTTTKKEKLRISMYFFNKRRTFRRSFVPKLPFLSLLSFISISYTLECLKSQWNWKKKLKSFKVFSHFLTTNLHHTTLFEKSPNGKHDLVWIIQYQ